MFVVFGVVALILFVYIRPQELIEGAQAIPFLYIWLGLASFGYALDLRLGYTKLQPTPQLRFVLVFFGWCMLTMVLRADPSRYSASVIPFVVSLLLYLLMAHGVQTFKWLQVMVVGILSAALFIAGIGVHQGFAPFGCARMADSANKETVFPDGRPCEQIEDCQNAEAEPGAYYVCEHIGLLGTTSVGKGRVRYRGILQDPNEVALTIASTIPFSFALRERKPIFQRTWFMVFCLLLIGTCVIFTKSRGGQLVLLSVVGAYFVKKYGVKGLAAGAVLALPALLLGGRSDRDSDSSSEERIEIIGVGVDLIRQFPVTGAGYDQFLEHHFLTAHNSYMLAVSENGLIGLVLFLSILFLSIKIPWKVLTQFEGVGEAAVARTWAMALLASYCGISIGIFFLSFTYHQVLWIFFGLSGALYSAVKKHDPKFTVRYGIYDFLGICLVSIAFVVVLFVFARIKHV